MDKEIKWNLIIERTGKRLNIIMPDEDGNLPPTPADGWVVRWPVNPHFTGRNIIASMLQNYEMFREYNFVE